MEQDGEYYEKIYRYSFQQDMREYVDRSYLLPLCCEQEPEAYRGERYQLSVDQSAYLSDGTVEIMLLNESGERCSCSAAFLLEWLSDGIWYPLNPHFSYPTAAYVLDQGQNITYTLSDRTLAQASLYVYDEATGRYMPSKEERTVELRPGQYRFRCVVTEERTGTSYLLCCTFALPKDDASGDGSR